MTRCIIWLAKGVSALRWSTDMRYLYSHQRESGYRDAITQLGLDWHGVAYASDISCEAAARCANC